MGNLRQSPVRCDSSKNPEPARVPVLELPQTGLLWLATLAITALLALPGPALAQTGTQTLQNAFQNFVCKIIEVLTWAQYMSGAVGMAAIVVLAIMGYFGRFDWGKGKGFVIGLILTAIAPAIVRYLLGQGFKACDSPPLPTIYLPTHLPFPEIVPIITLPIPA